jgi:hypothetical protein
MSDWKSSNHLKIEYLFQVCAYKHAKLEEYPNLPIDDIWILRLGKSEEEAGKFEPWHMTPDEYEEDFKGFLACLTLTRLVDSVEERMKHQKGAIRSIKKQQRETAKALAKEAEKLQKAMAKATAKLEKEKEKLRIKAEAKAERERLKAEKHMEKVMPVTTAIAKMLAVDIDTAGLPEGIQPRTDDVVLTGGGTVCMSTEPSCKPLPIAREALCETSSQSAITMSALEKLARGTPNLSTPAPETPQPVRITSTEAPERALPVEKEAPPSPYILPME